MSTSLALGDPAQELVDVGALGVAVGVEPRLDRRGQLLEQIARLGPATGLRSALSG
jgi:hypothetical protein